METIENIFQAEIVQRLGWTLIHFIWQATAISCGLAIVLKCLKKSVANTRYMVACVGLMLIVVVPVVTMKVTGKYFKSTSAITQQSMPEVAITEGNFKMPNKQVMANLTVRSGRLPVAIKMSLKEKFVQAVGPNLPYCVAGWLIGVMGLSLWYLGGWTQLQRLRKQMVRPVELGLKLKLRQLANAEEFTQ